MGEINCTRIRIPTLSRMAFALVALVAIVVPERMHNLGSGRKPDT